MFGVTDLAVNGDAFGIELDLDFDIGGGDLERAGELPGELRGRLLWRIDKAVTAIAIAGEHFEEIIIVPFPTDAEAVEGDALFALRFDFLLEGSGSTLPRLAAPSVSRTTR